jgi:hypothetical protein
MPLSDVWLCLYSWSWSQVRTTRTRQKLTIFFLLLLREQTENRKNSQTFDVHIYYSYCTIDSCFRRRLVCWIWGWLISLLRLSEPERRKCRRWPPAGSPTAAGLSTAAGRSPTAHPSRLRSTTPRYLFLSAPAPYYTGTTILIIGCYL